MKPHPASDPADLRRKAEARLKERPTASEPQSAADPRRLQHELEVHQIELEMQNEELRAAQMEIESGLERYTDLFQFAPVSYFTLAADGTVLQVNFTGSNLVGIDRSRLVGRRFGLLVAETHRGAFKNQLERVFATGAKQTSELRLTPEGKPPLVVRLEATRSPDGKECRSVLIDITERKRAEEALFASEVRYRRLFEAAKDGILILDADSGVVTDVNPFMAELLGSSHEEIRGKELWELGFFKDIAANRANFQELQKTGYIRYDDLPLESKQGRKINVEFVSNVYVAGNRKVIQCNVRDITVRKQIETALREREAEFRAAFDQAAVGKTQSDFTTGRFLRVNPTFCAMTGYGADALLAMSFRDITHPEDRDGDFEGFQHMVRGEKASHDVEKRYVRADGRIIWVRVSVVLILDDVGRPLRASSTVEDITPHKQAEAALRASEAQLRELARQLQNIREEERIRIAREIHDVLAQELTRLKIDVSRLAKRLAKPVDETTRQALAADAQATIGLADVAIQSVQRIATELRPVVLDSLGLSAAIEWLANAFQRHTGVDCHASIPVEDLSLDRDRATALFRITQECLTNVTRHAQATRVDIGLACGKNELVLTVRDNGRGITAEQRADMHSIGLAGMRERALAFGGTVEFTGAPGEGTTVTVRLPLGGVTRDA